MKETEFDIQVRNLLQDAQESVSPSVWEGVQAGLARKRRAAAFWRWGGAIAAAAAILSGVVLLWPRAEQEHSNPIILAETPSEALPEAPVAREELLPAEESAAPAARPVHRPLRLAQVTQKAAPVAEESVPVAEEPAPAMAESVPVAEESTPVTASQEAEDPTVFNRLAYEESRQQFAQVWSMDVSGNLEDKRRSTISSLAPRHYSAPPMGAAEGIYNENPEVSFSLPFSVGVGLNWQFARNWAVGAGLRYTNLSRTFVGDYKGDGFVLPQTDIDNHQHWLGIPLNVYYEILPDSKWSVHCFAGADVEYLLQNHYLVHTSGNDIHVSESGHGLQFSVGAGIGVEYRLTPSFGFFLDPSIRYYFNNHQPRSVRTIQPLRMDFQAGVRFSL